MFCVTVERKAQLSRPMNRLDSTTRIQCDRILPGCRSFSRDDFKFLLPFISI